jgi:hypothetical protein
LATEAFHSFHKRLEPPGTLDSNPTQPQCGYTERVDCPGSVSMQQPLQTTRLNQPGSRRSVLLRQETVSDIYYRFARHSSASGMNVILPEVARVK